MSGVINLVGKRYGKLTAVKDCGRSVRHLVLWQCDCECGSTTIVNSHDLRTGNTRSCGCLKDGHPTHGMSATPEHEAWSGMRARCYCKSHKRFPLYGGRGIIVCERWEKFENFLADMGCKPNKKDTLDRINVNGNYEPSNCRWTDWKTQQNNRRNNRFLEFNGQKLTASQWSEKVGIRSPIILQRINRDGWTVEKAITFPIGRPA